MVKIERSYPAPSSLAIEKTKVSGKYNKADVMMQLKKDFHDKCYLCNLKELSDPEVEHLDPHKGTDIDLKFSWDNLFLSCRHCNLMKNQRKYDGKIINCCEVDPEDFLIFICKDDDIKVVNKQDDEKSIYTAELLTEIFNKTNTGIRIYACEHRVNKLEAEMKTLYKQLQKYKKNPTSVRISKTLRGLLSRESQFAAFKRGYIKNNVNLFEDIQALLV